MASEPPRLNFNEMQARFPDNTSGNIGPNDMRQFVEQVRNPIGALTADHVGAPVLSNASLVLNTPTPITTSLWPTLVLSPFSNFADLTPDPAAGSITMDEIPGVFMLAVQVTIGVANNTNVQLHLGRDGAIVPEGSDIVNGTGINNPVPLSINLFYRSNAIITNPLTVYDLRLTTDNTTTVNLFVVTMVASYDIFSKDFAL